MSIREEPLIVNDVVLMSPGKWNGWNYSSNELKKAFSSTDWGDQLVTSLFIDHPANAANAANDWIGRINNPKQMPDGTVRGDLEIWDEDIAKKLTRAKANFGVSPRVIGQDDEETMSFLDFTFDNFSIVAKPAQSTAVLHLSKNLKFTGIVRQLNKDSLSSRDDEIDNLNSQSTNMLEKNMKGGKKQMSEEETKTEEETTEESTEEVQTDKAEESNEESTEKKEELSDTQVLSIMNSDLEGFNTYAKEMRVSNPSISLKELATKFKVQKERMNFVEELSDADATVLLKRLLSKIGVNELSTKKAKPASNDLANKIISLEKSIKELGKKERIAAPKTVKNLANVKSATPMMFGKAPSEGVMELAQMFGVR